ALPARHRLFGEFLGHRAVSPPGRACLGPVHAARTTPRDAAGEQPIPAWTKRKARSTPKVEPGDCKLSCGSDAPAVFAIDACILPIATKAASGCTSRTAALRTPTPEAVLESGQPNIRWRPDQPAGRSGTSAASAQAGAQGRQPQLRARSRGHPRLQARARIALLPA